MTSRTIASYGFSVPAHNPSVPVAATSTAYPSSSSPRLRSAAIFVSSSTMRIRMLAHLAAVAYVRFMRAR